MHILVLLKFTPLEFETWLDKFKKMLRDELKFTPLEFETIWCKVFVFCLALLKFTPLEEG